MSRSARGCLSPCASVLLQPAPSQVLLSHLQQQRQQWLGNEEAGRASRQHKGKENTSPCAPAAAVQCRAGRRKKAEKAERERGERGGVRVGDEEGLKVSCTHIHICMIRYDGREEAKT